MPRAEILNLRVMDEPWRTHKAPEIVYTNVCIFAGNFWSEGPELSLDSQRDPRKKKKKKG